MPLTCGTRLGPYEILSPIGAGGMGQVWKARDTRLDRTVAIKTSSAQFSERFEREARAVAALNHPNICTLHDVGPDYLVMEFIEGEHLKGPLPVAKVVEYAGQILDALDAAHRKGITHRDLKPANIIVTKQGIKLLDFGLAKHSGPVVQADSTVTSALTGRGQIIGTLQYMSAEQLHGKEADARSDLFSFGCVLYEMVTGKRAFEGQSAASVIAAILEREPPALAEAPPLDRVIRRSLAKDPDQRFQTARDLKAAFLWAMEQPPAATPGKPNRALWVAAAAAMLAACALAGWTVSRMRRTSANDRVLRVEVNPPTDGRFVPNITNAGGLAISPDGKMVAFVASVNGKTALWVRNLDNSSARLVPGTENAAFPFWSPNSNSIGFAAGAKLRQVGVEGGGSATICDVPVIRGASWGSDGYILFAALGSGLYRVSASGATPSPLTTLDASRGESAHRWPQVLPGGRFLYTVYADKPGNGGIYAASLTRPAERVKLLATESNAVYAPEADDKGYLLWLRGGALVAQEFNPVKLQFSGEPQPISGAVKASNQGLMYLAVSANGLLLHGAFGDLTQFAWFDRTGKVLKELGEPVDSNFMYRLSPDTRHIAIHRIEGGLSDLWLMDTERGLASRFTAGNAHLISPLWSPDGHTIMFTRFGSKDLLRMAANGTGNEQVVAHRPNGAFPLDWSGDGQWVLTRETAPDTGNDLWILPVTPDGRMREGAQPKPYLRTPFTENYGRFSPEPSPRHVAYESDESGRYEVYIDAFPEPRGKRRISTGGGRFPQWGAGGRELFYTSPELKLMAVNLKVGRDSVEPSAPHELFQLTLFNGSTVSPYEATPDGQRFLVLTSPEPESRALTLIVNWPALLRKTAP